MALLRLLWRLLRRRRLARVLLWVVTRLIRLFGWRRAVKVVFRNRRYLRITGIGAWRATVRLLRMGRSAWRLLGWIREHGPQLLAGGRKALRLTTGHSHRGGHAALRPRAHPTATVRKNLMSRVLHRRDVVRGSLLTAVGMDPNWRPDRKARPQLGDRTQQP
jgi:hypothetical protein